MSASSNLRDRSEPSGEADRANHHRPAGRREDGYLQGWSGGAGQTIVYATDTEHFACVDPTLRRLASGADILIYDAQYTPEEYPAKVGWGHSTWEAGAELARAAGVPQLVLFHHDPGRTDSQLELIERAARTALPGTVAAREGMILCARDAERAAAA